MTSLPSVRTHLPCGEEPRTVRAVDVVLASLVAFTHHYCVGLLRYPHQLQWWLRPAFVERLDRQRQRLQLSSFVEAKWTDAATAAFLRIRTPAAFLFQTRRLRVESAIMTLCWQNAARICGFWKCSFVAGCSESHSCTQPPFGKGRRYK